MKKITRALNVLALLVSIIVLIGCESAAQKELRQRVEETAATCPIEIAPGVTISTVEYSHDVVCYTVSFDSPLFRLELLADRQDQIRQLLIEAVRAADDPIVGQELRLCQSALAIVRFDLTDRYGQKMTVDVVPEEFVSPAEAA